MDKYIIIICVILLLIAAGCATTAYYQPDKTVSQAKQDLQDCIYETGEYIGGLNIIWSAEPCKQCMLDKGYKEVAIEELKKQKDVKIVPTQADYPSVSGIVKK